MQTRRRRKRRYAASIGGAFILLAVTGVITVIVVSLRLTGMLLDNTREKERFARIIQPVVMFDPVPFESPADIPPENLLLYSMWTALTDERLARNYTSYNEQQELLIPATDLNFAAAMLFGADITPEHRSFRDYDNTYTYYPDTRMYGIRVSPHMYVYTPDIVEITRSGDLYRLEVAYIPPGSAWNLSPAGHRVTPFGEKYMMYYMAREGSSYRLVGVQDPPSVTAMDLYDEDYTGEGG
ncbi:MAG: hypothetical protein FWH02_01885 [Oscillospiraceae bacterium]|nr:hypothetical protein [Oscillospiraceae bacterium]